MPKRFFVGCAWLLSSIFLIATVVAHSAQARTAAPLADVAFLADELRPWVAADIGGNTAVPCIIDTGSSSGVLPGRLLRDAQFVRSRSVEIASGSIASDVLRVKAVGIGAARVSNVNFIRIDRSLLDPTKEMPCVLGNDFLNHFTVDLDGRAGRFRLFARGTRAEDISGSNSRIDDKLPVEFGEGDMLWAKASVRGVIVRSQIDTGWGYTTPNSALLNALGIQLADTRIGTKKIPESLSGGAQEIRSLSDLRLGKMHVDVFVTSLTEINLEVIEAQRLPYLQIGWSIFRSHRLIVDRKHKAVTLVP